MRQNMFPYQRMITHVTSQVYFTIGYHIDEKIQVISHRNSFSTAVDCQISFMNHTGFPSIKKSRWERSEYGNYVFPIREWSQRLPQISVNKQRIRRVNAKIMFSLSTFFCDRSSTDYLIKYERYFIQ